MDTFALLLNDVWKQKLLTAEEEVDLAKKIEAGVYAQHLLDTDDSFTGQTRADLEEVIKEGREAKDRFIRSNLRLVISVARKSMNGIAGVPDMVQDGVPGVIRAVEKFDYTLGRKFSTYATPWIKQMISRARSEYTSVVHISSDIASKVSKMRKLINEYSYKNHHETPLNEYLAKNMGMTLEQISPILNYMRAWVSFDYSPDFEDGESTEGLGTVIPDDGDTPEESYVNSEMSRVLSEIINSLPDKEREAIIMSFGLRDGIEHGVVEIGKSIGTKRAATQQICRTAINRLRTQYGSMLKECLLSA